MFAAIGEAATGLAFLIAPLLVVHLLLGQDLAGVAVPVARVAGIALVGLGISLLPGPPLLGMLIYSAAVTLYLAYLGLGGLSGCVARDPICHPWACRRSWRPNLTPVSGCVGPKNQCLLFALSRPTRQVAEARAFNPDPAPPGGREAETAAPPLPPGQRMVGQATASGRRAARERLRKSGASSPHRTARVRPRSPPA
jgi:hypothetical protein